MPCIGCIEDYPVIEEAIQYGIEARGQRDRMAIQIACFWIDGWLAAGGNGSVTEQDAHIIREGVKNYIFI